MFKNKQDNCIKVVLKPGMNGSSDTSSMSVH